MAFQHEVLTTRQMRAIEAAAIDSGRVSGRTLMERAGEGVAHQIALRWSEAHEATILCGPGNNGGDGYVIARHLVDRGWRVRVAALAAPVTPDARLAAADWQAPVMALSALSPSDFAPGGLCVDALFGTGLTRPLDPEIARVLRMAADRRSQIVAVDILSGLDADSGRVLGGDELPAAALPAAALTVTFQRPRPGHLLGQGAELTGTLRVVDIGVEEWLPVAGDCTRLAGPDPRLLKRAGHKYDYGHALILGGGVARGGAARLAARAALRVGAGLVTLACPPEALPENAARLDAVMLTPLADAAALTALLGDARLNALCLGPGLGQGRARALVPVALASNRAALLDADALTAFADNPQALFALLHPCVVLTPHGGEFGRLFPDLSARLAAPEDGAMFSRLDAVRQAAMRAGCTVLLKGADTVIAAPDGTSCIAAAVGENAAPWLATAGSGDVLAGIITGLLARGFPPVEAAATGAWLHAEAARHFGPGLIAEDLPEALPAVFRALQG